MAESGAPICWVDITQLCNDACADLAKRHGMIQDQAFSLFEGMSAVELMDPKMDQCSSVPLVSIQSLLDAGAIDLRPSLGGAIETMRYLCVSELAWMDGSGLLESIYHCLYVFPEVQSLLQASESLPSRALLSFVQATLKTCGHFTQVIVKADIFEDEDFQYNMSRLSTCEEIDTATIVNDLDLCIDELKTESGEIASTALQLLQLRRRILLLASDMSDFCQESNAEEDLVVDEDGFSAESSTNMRNRIQLLQDKLAELHAILPSQAQLFSMADEKAYPTPGPVQDVHGFNANVACFLQPNPVRKIHYVELQHVTSAYVTYFKQLTTVLDEFVACIELTDDKPTIAYDMLWDRLFKISKDKLHVLARSFALVWLKWRGLLLGNTDLGFVIRESMDAEGVPRAIFQDEYAPAVLGRIQQVVSDTMKSFLVFRYRLLGRLEILFQSWGAIIREASFIDGKFKIAHQISDARQSYIASWVLKRTLRLMIVELEVMVEQELVSTNELDYFYWYWDYLLSTGLFVMEQLRNLCYAKEEAQAEMEAAQRRSNRSGKKARAKKKPVKNRNQANDRHEPTTEELVWQTQRELCRGYFRLFVGLSLSGVTELQRKDHAFTSWNARFAQRFRSFQHLPTPQPLVLDDFIAACSSPGVQASSLIQASVVCFEQTKQSCEMLIKSAATPMEKQRIDGLKQLLKAALINFVSLHKAKRSESGQLVGQHRITWSAGATFPQISFV